MTIKSQSLFWLVVYIVLILLYGNSFESYLYSIYFVTILFPVVIGTAYFFNFYLVPKYLMKGRKGKFVLYFIYLFIVSAHLEIIMIFLAFIYLANYRVSAMHPSILDVSNLSVTLFAIVFTQGFFLLFKKYQTSSNRVERLEYEQKKAEQGYLLVRVERKNRKVPHEQILYIESLSDYVKIHTNGDNSPIVTKAKISKIEKELPKEFIRVHRSFLVNRNEITSFNAEQVQVAGEQLPISRTYKQKVKELLNKS
ncbi:LytR/AlgR family response regulator transcription factor [Reichenbachiella sp.]|uniref:LytR/AlgR family response regulator transcription factor n=1 Tax=Reichenbachiella sp. TaxID=2184521 RepID=UPI003B5963EA